MIWFAVMKLITAHTPSRIRRLSLLIPTSFALVLALPLVAQTGTQTTTDPAAQDGAGVSGAGSVNAGGTGASASGGINADGTDVDASGDVSGTPSSQARSSGSMDATTQPEHGSSIHGDMRNSPNIPSDQRETEEQRKERERIQAEKDRQDNANLNGPSGWGRSSRSAGGAEGGSSETGAGSGGEGGGAHGY